MTTYIKITPDGGINLIHPETLSDLQTAVGGLITSAYSPNLTEATIYANDEGLLLGMPENPVASYLLGTRLVGPVIIAGPVDEEGNVTDAHKIELDPGTPPDVQKTLANILAGKGEVANA